MNTRALGAMAEELAWRYLDDKGYFLDCKNYRCEFGEIDLIVRKNDVIVFVEVKSRKDDDILTALEQVNRTKQLKIIKSAQHYLHLNKRHHCLCRFDVIGVVKLETATPDLTWIPNAFIHNWN